MLRYTDMHVQHSVCCSAQMRNTVHRLLPVRSTYACVHSYISSIVVLQLLHDLCNQQHSK
jgi:hypothetical protein